MSSNATLFYAVRRNDEYDMVSGSIIEGYVQFKIRCKSSYVDLTIPKFRVDDGEWHKVSETSRTSNSEFVHLSKLLTKQFIASVSLAYVSNCLNSFNTSMYIYELNLVIGRFFFKQFRKFPSTERKLSKSIRCRGNTY